MPAQLSSFFRPGSARFVACGVLLPAALLLARLHVLAACSALIVVAFAGGLRRLEEQASRREQASSKLVSDAAPHLASPSPANSSLATRQMLEARIDAELKREQASTEPASLLLIEVDAINQLEEHGGALAADVAMLTLASALARMLPREADLLARYDERTFAVLLRATDLPGGLRVAARLRWSIVHLGIAHPHTQSGFLTACMGLAVQHGASSRVTATLLQTAEAALARARHLGHDHLEYVELDQGCHPEDLLAPSSLSSANLPAIRAWSPEPVLPLHSPPG